MASIMTLSGSGSGLGRERRDLDAEGCKCVFNKRTKKSAKLCFVGKSKSAPTGWKFKGLCRR